MRLQQAIEFVARRIFPVPDSLNDVFREISARATVRRIRQCGIRSPIRTHQTNGSRGEAAIREFVHGMKRE